MKSVGGYFQIENTFASREESYHRNALKLNTARNSLEYILKSEKYTKVFIPFYSCSSILEPLKKLNIQYEFYNLDKNFLPVLDKALEKEEAVLIINYFGLIRSRVSFLKAKYKNMILDNTQDFFFKEFPEMPAIYSCRKFFGVSDGGCLYYPEKELYLSLPEDTSYDRMEYLYKKYELGSEAAYDLYLENERKLNNQPMKRMSRITDSLLKRVDYEKVRKIRNENFKCLHEKLKGINKLSEVIEKNPADGPMYYPFLLKEEGKINGSSLKKFLIEKKVYVPTYWREVSERVEEDSFEMDLVQHLVSLPVDQRNTQEEMEQLLNLIEIFQK